MIDNRTAGRRIAMLRQERGLTQAQIAVLMDVSHQAVSKWESGAALPDIQTMLRLTDFFGITVERLLKEEQTAAQAPAEEAAEADPGAAEHTETNREVKMMMTFSQLMQMAPFMSKEAVEEIALGMEGLTAREITRLAPFVRREAVKALIDKNAPELDWDSLRRLAPFMAKEDVDAIARSIAAGDTKVQPSRQEAEFNKAIDDIGRTIDEIGKGVGKAFEGIAQGVGSTLEDIGKGMEKAVRKAVRFGESVFGDAEEKKEADEDAEAKREARVQKLRRMAFERALQSENWDWLAEHLCELAASDPLYGEILEAAKKAGEDMGGQVRPSAFVDGMHEAVKAAEELLAKGNWDEIDEDTLLMLPDELQAKIALRAKEEKEWDWIDENAVYLHIESLMPEYALEVLAAGQEELFEQLVSLCMPREMRIELAEKADLETLALLAAALDEESEKELATRWAQAGNWERVKVLLEEAENEEELAADLLEIAVNAGDFAAIDMLDEYL